MLMGRRLLESSRTGDFNGAGRTDILWRNMDGQAAIWDMNGNSMIGGGPSGSSPWPNGMRRLDDAQRG